MVLTICPGIAGTPAAASDPAAYYTAHNDTHQIVYRAANGHLYELYWVGVAPVAGWDLTAATGAPPAVGNPSAYYVGAENTKHVIYRSSDGRLHEIWWHPGQAPGYSDLTAFAGAPLAAESPAGFTENGRQHVAYRGTDSAHLRDSLVGPHTRLTGTSTEVTSPSAGTGTDCVDSKSPAVTVGAAGDVRCGTPAKAVGQHVIPEQSARTACGRADALWRLAA